mmetsp:Transcript_13766/g.34604  ORF Transcript_13766/g.34604 Transcript_13766/m.34604 type:complete len:391 (-) Transcript_13766:43-1215(-)
MNSVDGVVSFFGKGDVERVDALLELRDCRGADDGAAVLHVVPVRYPGEGHFHHARVLLLCHLGILGHRLAAPLLQEPLLILLEDGEARLCGESPVQVLSREDPTSERRPSQQADIAVPRGAGLRQLRLELPVHQRKGVLDGDGRGNAQLVAEVAQLANPVAAFVGDPPVLDLPLIKNLLEAFQGFLEGHRVLPVAGEVVDRAPEAGHVPVWPVQLVQVDVRGLQPDQRGIHRAQNVLRVQPGLVLLVGVARVVLRRRVPARRDVAGLGVAHHLGRDIDLLPQLRVLREPSSDVLLRQPLRRPLRGDRVELRRVQKVDAPLLDRVVQLLVRLGLRVLLAEGHRAEAHVRHVHVARTELVVPHDDDDDKAFPSSSSRNSNRNGSTLLLACLL